MNILLTLCLVAVIAALLVWGMQSRERVYQYPFLTGVITLAFILPQVPGLATASFLPEDAFPRTLAFMLLCLFCCWWGWTSRTEPIAFLRMEFEERRLLLVALFLSLAGAFFYFKLSRLPGDLTIAVQMTGVPVIYVFFSRLLCYGLAIAALCLARRWSWPAALIIGFDLIFYLDRILVTGKRAEAVELSMIFLLSWWFYKRRAVPRSIVLAALFFGTLGMNSMGDYRAITQANDAPVWEDVKRIDVVGNFEKVMRDGGDEMRNAIFRINNTATTLRFDYGKFHWNRLVFSFVPAQLVGPDLKQNLMLSMPPMALDYNPILGTTETGLADAFQSFWYFGALKFLLIAYLVKRIWVTADGGAFAAQFVYLLSIVPAMHAISHQTDWVLMVWVHMAMFAAPALLCAWIPRRNSTVRSPFPALATG